MSDDVAPKFDGWKPRVDLVVPAFIMALGRVLAFGAKKYGAWTWSKGKLWSQDYGAALRHLLAWAEGEDLDPESGEPHLAHAATDIMLLLISQLRGLGTDDRHKFAAPAPAKPEGPVYAANPYAVPCLMGGAFTCIRYKGHTGACVK